MTRKLILGGPGCGKTTALLNIVESLFKQGVDPSKLAYLAFTKKAAVEAIERAQIKFKYTEEDLPYFRTIHSFAFKALGLSRDEVLSTSGYKEIGELLNLQFGGIDPEIGLPVANGTGDVMASLEQLSRITLTPLDKLCCQQKVKYFDAKLYRDTVEKYKRTRILTDFTDMLEKFVDVGKVPNLDAVIVDEAQDLSPLQWKVVDKICQDVPKVYYAGDDDQAIYGWAGADVDHFLSLKAQREVLPISYRLSKPIFNLCQDIAKRIRKRYSKDWKPSSHEGAIERYGRPDYLDCKEGTWLLLARNKHLLKSYKEHMEARGYPYKIGPRSSIDTASVRAIVTWEDFRKGKPVLLDKARSMTRFIVKEVINEDPNVLRDWPDEWISHHELKDILRMGDLPNWMDALDIRSKNREYYRSILARGESLVQEPRIQIATIHTVKGGEADNVAIMPDMARRSYDSMGDDESRVFYVAASRARYNLHLIHPQTERYYRL